jgi:hypothetical protein
MDILKKIFGKNSIHLKVVRIFYNNGYFNNITGLAITVRKVINDLVDAGILREMTIGKSMVIKANDESPYLKALFDFLSSVQSIRESKSIEDIIERRSKETSFGRMGAGM